MFDYDFNLIEVPKSFNDRFLWNPCPATTSGNPQGAPSDPIESLPAYQFYEETVAEVQAALSYQFWSSSQSTITIPQSEPVNVPTGFTLYCPFTGANDVIDSLVRLVAAREKAEVLVLDALELAAGQFGALGKSARVIDNIYKAVSAAEGPNSDKSQDPSIDDQSAQNLFDILMNIEAKSTLSGQGTGCDPNDSGPRRRILYLRDFGSIARTAKLLMFFILQAIQTCSRKGNSLALIMGVTAVTESAVTKSARESDQGFLGFLRRRTEESQSFRASRKTLSQKIPSINHKCSVLKNGASSALPNALGAELFLPLTFNPSELHDMTLAIEPTRAKNVDDLVSNESFLVAFPKNARCQEFREKQNVTSRTRRKAINDILLRIHLARMGGSTCERPSHDILAEGSKESLKDHFLSSILDWSTATSIATTAIGLACMEAPSAPVPMYVSSGTVAKAYQLFIQNDRARADLVDEEEAQSDQSDKAEDAIPEENDEEGAVIIDRVKKDKDRNKDSEDGGQDQQDEGGDLIIKRVRESRDLSMVEKKQLRCLVDSGSLRTRFDDVCVEPTVIETLRTVISLPLLHPAYFKTGLLSKECITGVLLYGPPGTGKTMLCRALASECKARMLFVKPSDILESCVGESEQNIAGLFSLARRLAPCVLFIDEVDALFSARDDSTKSWRRDMLTEFMQAMDGLLSAGQNRDKGIIVIGASNRPFDLDEAILRRLPCRMMVDLPPESERLKILKLYLKEEILHNDVDLLQIAHDTEDYSGSDLKSLCVAAALKSVKNAIGNIEWSSGTQSASPRAREARGENYESSNNIGTQPIIGKVHFDQARSAVFPSFSEKASAELYSWHKKFSSSAGSRLNTSSNKRVTRKTGSSATSVNGRADADVERFMASMFGNKT